MGCSNIGKLDVYLVPREVAKKLSMPMRKWCIILYQFLSFYKRVWLYLKSQTLVIFTLCGCGNVSFATLKIDFNIAQHVPPVCS